MRKVGKLVLIILVLSISGCMPLPQYEVIDKSSDTIAQVSENNFFMIWVDQTYWSHQLQIIPELSWAKGPSGNSYKIKIEEKTDSSQKQKMYEIYVISKSNKVISTLENGVWTLSLHFESNGEEKVKEIQFKLSTFFYSPFIHGAPN